MIGPFALEAKRGHLNLLSLDVQQECFRFVTDDESLLGDPRPPFRDWVESHNTRVQSGSRVLCRWRSLIDRSTASGLLQPPLQPQVREVLLAGLQVQYPGRKAPRCGLLRDGRSLRAGTVGRARAFVQCLGKAEARKVRTAVSLPGCRKAGRYRLVSEQPGDAAGISAICGQSLDSSEVDRRGRQGTRLRCLASYALL